MVSLIGCYGVRGYWQFLLVLAIQFGLVVRAIVRALTAFLLVATLLRDGLFDPGGIGLPPSLTYKAGFGYVDAISIAVITLPTIIRCKLHLRPS